MENNNADRPTKSKTEIYYSIDQSTQASIDFHFQRNIQIESKRNIDSQKVLSVT